MAPRDTIEIAQAVALEALGDRAVLAGEPARFHFRAAQSALRPAGRHWSHQTDFDRRLMVLFRLADKLGALDAHGRLVNRCDRSLFEPVCDQAA